MFVPFCSYLISQPFKLACDASQIATGTVLYQEDEEGQEWPIAYFSRKLTPVQSSLLLSCL